MAGKSDRGGGSGSVALQGRGTDGIGQINQINVFETEPAGDAAPVSEREPRGEATERAPAPPDEPARGRKARQAPGEERPADDPCHQDYVDCLPVVDDLDCGDPALPEDGTLRLRDPENNAYGLDVSQGVGNGIGCDDES